MEQPESVSSPSSSDEGVAVGEAGRASDPVAPAAPRWIDICPYLLDVTGTWRSTQPSGEHRCTAVTPPVPLRAERQRRLCLGADHLDCPTYLAAREIRVRTLGDVGASGAARRGYARTVPVILEQPATVVVAFSALRTSLPQVGLIVLMLLAVAALVLARFVSP